MEKVEIIEGVVAEYNGKFWGKQLWENMDFGDFDRAEISNPKYCQKPTDKTYDPKNTNGYNPEFTKLSKARLLSVKKTIVTKFEIL